MTNHINHTIGRLILGSLLGAALSGGIAHGASGTCLLNYQGVVEVEGGAYSGNGYFKFTLGNAAGTTNLWSSDGTVTGMPAASVLLDVTNGFFHAMLGGESMTPLPRSIVVGTNLYLQVWFLHTLSGTYCRLGPSQLLLPVPSAVNADMIDGKDYADIATAIYNAVTMATNDLPTIYVFRAGDNMTGILNMGGQAVTNATVMQSVTGQFAYVSAATGAMPVPYWQLTSALARVTTLASGETDTNRTDILFTTNYHVSAVCVWQRAATNQFVYLLTNDVVFDSFTFNGTRATKTFAVDVGKHDRLCIACSNACSIIEFAFEGNQN